MGLKINLSNFYLFLYFCSGFSLLGLETVWIRETSSRLGGVTSATAFILTVLFLCSGIGAWVCGMLTRRTTRPLWLYGTAEIFTGFSACSLFFFKESWSGSDHAYPFFLAALPALAAGMSLPALAAALVETHRERVMVGGKFYATNLGGAAAGVIFGSVILPYFWGYRTTLVLLCALLIFEGCAAMLIVRKQKNTISVSAVSERWIHESATNTSQPLIVLIAILSGVLSINAMVLFVAYFQLIAANSIYAFAVVFCTFLTGLGIGAFLATVLRRWIYGAWSALLTALLLACVALMWSPFVLQLTLENAGLLKSQSPLYYYARLWLAAILNIIPPAALVGAVYPLVWEMLFPKLSHGAALGLIVLLNKVGCAVGAIAAAFFSLRTFGLPGSFSIAASGYGLAALAVAFFAIKKKPAIALSVAAALLPLFSFAIHKPPVVLRSGEQLLALYSDQAGLVSVTESRGSRQIQVNRNYTLNGTDRALPTQRNEGWLPCALHKEPKQVMFIGMASGISAAAMLDFPLEELTAVELLGDVVTAAEEWFGPWNNSLFSDPRVKIVKGDGRRMVRNSQKRWDLIVCDLFNPVQEKDGLMYTLEFFTASRRALAKEGIFCLWIPFYQHSEKTIEIIARTFCEVFPSAIALRANFDPLQPVIGFFGSNEQFDLSDTFLHSRFTSPEITRLRTKSFFLKSASHFRLAFFGDLSAVSQGFQSALLSSDDHPHISFLGPFVTPQNGVLRGIPLLRWGGTRFLNAQMPSIKLGVTPPQEIESALRAGNYLYAASVLHFPLPGAAIEDQVKRHQQAEEHLETARKLWPYVETSFEELEGLSFSTSSAIVL